MLWLESNQRTTDCQSDKNYRPPSRSSIRQHSNHTRARRTMDTAMEYNANPAGKLDLDCPASVLMSGSESGHWGKFLREQRGACDLK